MPRPFRLITAFVLASTVAACAAPPSVPHGVWAPTAVAHQQAAAVWVHPVPPFKPGYGSVDWARLFADPRAWHGVAGKTAAFGLYAGWVTQLYQGNRPAFNAMTRFLHDRGIPVEIEAPSLQAATCGNGIEGFVPVGQSLSSFTRAYLHLLRSSGVTVAYIKVDEPYYFASVSSEPGTCHWPPAKVAGLVARFTRMVHAIDRSVQVGDVEPVIPGGYPVDVVTALLRWHAAYAAANGAPFPFYIADVDFADPSWPSLVKRLERDVHGNGMPFGIIYIGDMTDRSDRAWSEKVVARFRAYQVLAGGRPDFVLFQSWDPYPHYCLPESNPTTFMGVVQAYFNSGL
ncbi:MAG: hypothetical protein JOY98_13065 [Candidatus Eremiobacteraeota bacterium]|nr:hypothetical protein [Candidatus Eremiobacteraeota bacterium]